jgi:hypothetical protein
MENTLENTLVENNQSGSVPEQAKENFIAGLVGAVLFSLAGVVIWFIIYQLGYIAGIAGIVTIVCAHKGYEIFGKVLSLKGLIAGIVVAVAMIYVAEYICLGYDVYVAFKEEYAISIFDALRSVPDFLLEEPVRDAFFTDLMYGYGFSLLGILGSSIGKYKNRNR